MNAVADSVISESILSRSALASLEARIAEHFLCVQGPARASFTLQGEHKVLARFTFRTILFGSGSVDTDHARLNLSDEVFKQVFQPIIASLDEPVPDPHSHLLFWRKRPHFGTRDDGTLYLRMRLCIPGVDLPEINS